MFISLAHGGQQNELLNLRRYVTSTLYHTNPRKNDHGEEEQRVEAAPRQIMEGSCACDNMRTRGAMLLVCWAVRM